MPSLCALPTTPPAQSHSQSDPKTPSICRSENPPRSPGKTARPYSQCRSTQPPPPVRFHAGLLASGTCGSRQCKTLQCTAEHTSCRLNAVLTLLLRGPSITESPLSDQLRPLNSFQIKILQYYQHSRRGECHGNVQRSGLRFADRNHLRGDPLFCADLIPAAGLGAHQSLATGTTRPVKNDQSCEAPLSPLATPASMENFLLGL